jgi:hypothetical protein
MTMIKSARRFAFVLGLVIANSVIPLPSEAALLEGKTMAALLMHKTTSSSTQTGVDSGPFVVGPGVELTNFGQRENPTLPALVDIDVSDMQILLTLLIDQPSAFLEAIRIGDLQNNIEPFNVRINSTTNWVGFNDFRLAGSNQENVEINLSGLSGLQGQQILLDVVPVPEPAGTLLLLVGASLASGFRARAWRRRA